MIARVRKDSRNVDKIRDYTERNDNINR
jgi:hypothetical protein